MFLRLILVERHASAGGKYIHTDPVKGPPRHDLRKLRTLPDPDLDRDLSTHDPDLDIPEV